MSKPALAPLATTDWFGQPRGLTILFLTEMWEKFSFYGMRALLVLYLVEHLAIPQARASWIYGIYASAVYLTQLFGGVISDRWLGGRAAVITGGLIMAVGHFMMASESLVLFALGTIAIGSGLYLPSLPSQIDSLYARADPRRKSAYNVYYVGVNLGAFAAPIVIGTVGERYSFHWGFALAGLGMIAGLVTYVAGSRYLPTERRRYSRADTARAVTGDLDCRTTPSIAIAASPPLQAGIGRRFALLLAVAATIVIFRGAYEQLGNTVALWADQSVDRAITPTQSIPVTWFQSLNPLLVFLFTPLLVIHWTRLTAQRRDLPSAMKMVIGATIVGASYLLVAAVAFWAEQHDLQVGWPWVVAFIVTMTAGELYILPVGLGLFGRAAPEGLAATTIALWYSAGFLGNLLAGWLGTLWSPLGHGAFFSIMGAVAVGAAALLAVLVPRVSAMERGE